MKMIKRLFCKHKHVDPLYTYLERQEDGSWIAYKPVFVEEEENNI